MLKISVLAAVLLFTSCTRYVLEERRYGLSETFNLPEKGVIIKMDTLKNEFGGVSKGVLIKRPEKK
jgi:hypothetical protein